MAKAELQMTLTLVLTAGEAQFLLKELSAKTTLDGSFDEDSETRRGIWETLARFSKQLGY